MNKRDAKKRLQQGMTKGDLAKLLASVPPEDLQGMSILNHNLTKEQVYAILRGAFTDPTDPRRVPAGDYIALNVLREFGGER